MKASVDDGGDADIHGLAAQAALRNGQRERIHHADKRNDPARLAIEANRFANAADGPPIGADPAAARCEPDIFVPGVDDTLKAVVDRIQIAGNGEAAPCTAVRKDGRCRHEPELRDIVIDALGVRLIVGIGTGHAHKQILIGLAVSNASRLASISSL